MKKTSIYLFTLKENGQVQRYAFKDKKKAVENWNREKALYESQEYDIAEQAMYDDEVFVKVAKMTDGDDVARMRLEKITLYK
jgi:hypothetical protein